MKLIDKNLLDKVTAEAKANARLRMNYNFHETLDRRRSDYSMPSNRAQSCPYIAIAIQQRPMCCCEDG